MSIHRCVVFAFLIISRFCTASPGYSSNIDPYEVFGLDRGATQDEIRSKYRKLCLQYHPDKTVGKSLKEQRRCTQLFKRIQAANDLIGDPESRRSYDSTTIFSSQNGRFPGATSSSFPRHQFRDESVDAFYRAFTAAAERQRNEYSFVQRNPFYGFGRGNVVPPSSSFGGRTAAMFRNGSSLKSTYLQKVKVPLQDLYKGRPGVEFKVEDTLWKSYCASFRGGLGYLILYQSLIFAAPMIKFSRLVTLALGAAIFHMHVPRPTSLQFTADIKPGYKEGTKIIFRDEGFDTIFLIEEEKHDRFARVGNDLHTRVEILASQAEEGCAIEIESLDPSEEPTRVKIRPKQIDASNNNVIVVKGKGWPIRKTGRRGDLVITFRIVRALAKQKQKRSKKKPAKHAI